MDAHPLPTPDNLFERLLFAAPEAIVVVNSMGVIVLVNARACALFGYAQAELSGQPLGILLPEKMRSAHTSHLARFFSSRESRSMGRGLELVGQKKDGGVIPVDISLSLVETSKGPLSIAWISDLTASKLAAAAVREAETRYRTLVEQLPAATYIQALDAQSTTLYISPQIETISGYSAAEWAGNPQLRWDILYPTDRDRVRAMTQAHDELGEPFSLEYRLLTRGGRVIWVHDEAAIVRNEQGQAAYTQGLLSDVTERKLAQEKLELSANILDTIVNLVVVANAAGMITYASPSVEKILGYTPAELLGEGWWRVERGPTADVAGERSYVMRAAAGEIPPDGNPYEHYFRAKNGEPRWLVIQDAKGPGDLLIGVGTDITARKAAEEALRTSEAQYRDLVESASDIIYRTDVQGNFVYANPIAVHVMGYSSDRDLIGKNFIELIRPDARAAAAEFYAGQSRREGANTYYEFPAVTGDGREIWIGQNVQTIVRENEAIGFQAVARDITERIQIEHQVRNERDFAQHVMKAMGQGLSITDRNRKLIYLNPAFTRMLGYPPETWYGRTPEELVAVEDHARLQESAARHIRGETTTDEVRLIHQMGHLVPVLVTSAPRWNGPHFDGTVSVFTDLTAQKTLEQAMERARDQAVEASRLKSEFLAMMSHEIRTPMNSIVGMTELLLDTPLDTDQREFATIAHLSSLTLLDIINDILDFSKIEAGKLVLDHSEFDLLSLVEDTAEIVSGRARDKNLALMTYVSPALPRFFMGDSLRLRQVLLNLLSNAIKFTEQGHVTVRVEPDSTDASAFKLHVSVQDTGIGISEQVQARLFQAFTQADSGITRKYGGTGLGLAISKRIVEMMGGALRVTSEPGKGSIFYFTVPLAPVPGRTVPVATTSLPERILIVDDEPAHSLILHSYLDAWQIPNLCVAEGNAALEELRRAKIARVPYDVVLIDFRMPQMDGLALARAIKADAALENTHLLLVTAFDTPALSRDAMHNQFDAVLTKPIRKAGLRVALENTVENQERPEKVAVRPKSLRPREPIRGPRVLVVEDDVANQKMADLQLRYLGYSAQIAGDGQSAIRSLQNSYLNGELYSLILMDCMMPEMDGFTTTREIRAWEAERDTHIPIIAMTANAMQGDHEACFAAGMDDYLAKPVEIETLKAMLGKWTPTALPAKET